MLNKLEDILQGVFVLRDLSTKTMARLLSFGERLSVPLLTSILIQNGLPAHAFDARDLIITHDDNYLNASVKFEESYQRIGEKMSNISGVVPVITGFIAADSHGETTTLGRGGSDFTASLIAVAMKVEKIVIWTDVDGMLTANPKLVKNAHCLEQLSYKEAMELSHFGAKVIYPPTLAPAFAANVPILIKNTFSPQKKGTLITHKGKKNDALIRGISTIDDICLLTISGSIFIGVPGVAAKLFNSLATYHVNIILITQSSSEHTLCIGMTHENADLALKMLHDVFEYELSKGFVDPIKVEYDKSVLAIIGDNMREKPGLSSKLFGSLGNNGVNIDAIAQGSSEMNISVVIDKADLRKAVNVIHQVFFSEEKKILHVFLCGTGLIGSTLLKQMENQAAYLLNEKGLEIKIVGLSNSRKMIFSSAGLSFDTAFELMNKNGEKANIKSFTAKMFALNLSNSIFVDCTSSEEVIREYKNILNHAISIVTPNKLANSGDMDTYKTLKHVAFSHGVRFLYETNVGAGLPIISTLNDLRDSGDEIYEIEGVLSGTMSYIFNTFDENTTFLQAVKMAKEKGYTEPDPREDLKGNDVARKILILAREAGLDIEPNQIEKTPILSQRCLDASTVDDFFKVLEEEAEVFENMRKKASDKGEVLRFIAKAEKRKVSLSLQSVDHHHPCYNLSGSDNIISFKTNRYNERPLVIKGPGAGGEVTAAGVFAEVINISKMLYQGVRNKKPRKKR